MGGAQLLPVLIIKIFRVEVAQVLVPLASRLLLPLVLGLDRLEFGFDGVRVDDLIELLCQVFEHFLGETRDKERLKIQEE